MRKIKKLLTAILAMGFVLALFSPRSEAYKNMKDVEFLGNHNVPGGQPMQLGTQITTKKVQLLRCSYSFLVQGVGSSSVVNLKDTDGSNCSLPPGAIVIDGMIDGLFIPAGAGSIAIGSGIFGQAAGDLKAAAAASTYSGLLDVIPASTAATAIKNNSTLPAVPKMTMTFAAVTSGKFNVYIEYYLSQ